METILNPNGILPRQLNLLLQEIQCNPENSFGVFTYRILPNFDIELDFTTTSHGTSRQVAGSVAGVLSKVFGRGFRVR